MICLVLTTPDQKQLKCLYLYLILAHFLELLFLLLNFSLILMTLTLILIDLSIASMAPMDFTEGCLFYSV